MGFYILFSSLPISIFPKSTKNCISYNVLSKGGLKSLTQSMACELAPIGVRVNAIAPGVIETDMTTEILQDEVRKQRFLNRIPMGRVGQPEELWGAVAFLLSPLASYVTGVTLPIDGGYLAN